MDEAILKCDVAFGADLAEPVFSFKESPSHQSDSGCSDMSEDRSVSPASGVGLLSPVNEIDESLFDFGSVKSVEEMDEFSEELESYLATPLQNIDHVSIHSNLQTPVLPASAVNRQVSPVSSSPEISVDDDDNDPDYQPSISSRVIQSKARVPVPKVVQSSHSSPNATVIKVPASSTSNINKKAEVRVLSGVQPSSKVNSTPAIKVVKVVKTTAKHKRDVENEIFEALEERNKKNAVQAKLNREKKKAYLKTLEDENETLRNENDSLKQSVSQYEQEKQELVEEVAYLKSVLANQSVIGGLLKNIGTIENIKLTSSVNRKRGAGQDHEYVSSKRARSHQSKTAGVCLHVDQGNVSLEFCSKCATMAKCTEQDENA